MIEVNSLLEYFLGLKRQFQYDSELVFYYDLKINHCKELLQLGIYQTTFEKFENLV